ncbi:MAG TPA: RNA polymerase sigma factor [Pyrinomonadaceae bacterium]|nr:RNA polymerase sigma factor [Pyrinomonadaceae bacterium]
MTALQSDEQLLRLTLGGDARAFETLYDRLQGGIYRYALRMTGSQTTAEDVTQEVFLSLIRDRCDYVESKGKFKSYLYAMARHRLLRKLERERNFVSLEADDDRSEPVSCHDPFLDLARAEVIDLVRQAVLSLPAHFREVIVLCYLQEMNYADAGEIIDCPVGTVRSRLARARALLVKKLGVLKTSEAPEIAATSIPV